ncbi:MAG: metallophosphoesterase [Geminicoccaceae bacterium]
MVAPLFKKLLGKNETPAIARPSVEGRPAALPPGIRIYAVGDIHGRADLLRAMHEQIISDRLSAPADTECVIVYLGDYVDRGLDSASVLDELINRPVGGFDLIHLIGNHDIWMLDFLDEPEVGAQWFQWGGDATLVSYGVQAYLELDDLEQLKKARNELAKAVPPSHLAFLNGLKLRFRLDDYLFVHAGIRPGTPVDRQLPHDLLYIREPFLSHDDDLGCVVVHGHTVQADPVLKRNRIGIDTGACWTGKLTCVVLEGEDIRFLATR